MTDTKSVGAALRVDLLNADAFERSELHSESNTEISLRIQAALLLRRLGANLESIAPEKEFQSMARKIQAFLLLNQTKSCQGIYPPDIPQFFDDILSVPTWIDPRAFSEQMRTAQLDDVIAADSALMARNLVSLEVLLGLSSAERKLLLWSYCTQREPTGCWAASWLRSAAQTGRRLSADWRSC